MERVPLEKGRVVLSTQGRDMGRCFVVLQIIDDQFVMMCDGMTRKLDHQKKKKIKHLHIKPVKMENLEYLQKTNQLKDSDIKNFIVSNGLCEHVSCCKEG